MQHHFDLQSILKSFDKREKKFLAIVNPEKRYYAFSQLDIDAMKLQVQYAAGSSEEEQIMGRRERYGSYQRIIQQDVNEQARRKYGNPFVVVQFDDLGVLVRDQEAIQANLQLQLRNYQNQ